MQKNLIPRSLITKSSGKLSLQPQKSLMASQWVLVKPLKSQSKLLAKIPELILKVLLLGMK